MKARRKRRYSKRQAQSRQEHEDEIVRGTNPLAYRPIAKRVWRDLDRGYEPGPAIYLVRDGKPAQDKAS